MYIHKNELHTEPFCVICLKLFPRPEKSYLKKYLKKKKKTHKIAESDLPEAY